MFHCAWDGMEWGADPMLGSQLPTTLFFTSAEVWRRRMAVPCLPSWAQLGEELGGLTPESL